MERVAWTDQRLDDAFANVNRRLDVLHEDLRGVHQRIDSVHGTIEGLRAQLVTILLGLCIALIGAIAGLLVAV